MVYRSPIVRVGPSRKSGELVTQKARTSEMTKNEGRSRVRLVKSGGNFELMGEESSWPRGIDDEARLDREGLSALRSRKLYAPRALLDAGQVRLVAIVHALGNRLSNEMVIDIRSKPMRIRERIVRARGDKQPLRVEAPIDECLVRMMAEKGEAALEP